MLQTIVDICQLETINKSVYSNVVSAQNTLWNLQLERKWIDI